MVGSARVLVNKSAEPLIVVVAESLKKEPWWLYHTLVPGGDSLKSINLDDVDNFAVYDFLTKKMLIMIGDGRWSFLFRIHDGNHVNIFKKSETEAGIIMLETTRIAGGLHTCTGKGGPTCYQEQTLKFDSSGLKYVWALPAHLKYENTFDFKW